MSPPPPPSRSPRPLRSTPLAAGFSFPAEWAPQSGTWFSWPRPEGISFPGRYHTVPAGLAAIIREIAPRQRVHINVPNANWQRLVTEQLAGHGVPRRFLPPCPPDDGDPEYRCPRASRVRFHFVPTNESWCRDHGPTFVVKREGGREQFAIVDWGFNAWGGKYPPYDADDAVPTEIAAEYAAVKHPRFAGLWLPRVAGQPVVMEGGAVEFNGAGTVMTTDSCLLNKNRNPHLSKKQIEKALKDWYGQRHVVWLGEGIAGDDTDGHVDDLARFIGPRTILTTVEEDPHDENYKVLQDNLRRLALARDQDGKPFDVVTVPMPGVVEHAGQRLPATYANFLFINGALLVPTFRHRKNDRRALSVMQEALDALGRACRVIGVDCTELIWGLGAIHCLTQQVPRAAG
ncbi:MAG TPA: agmatine deiminase family protein [Phycisphaerales bacterium]|nr:agmatine deiminase family protein [Phycisphaerales bacterium]